MTRRESSRLKNKATRTTVPARRLKSLANQIKLLLARRTTVPARSIQSTEERLTNVIEEHQLLAPLRPEVGAHIQTESTTPATQSVEEQVQLDSTTLAGNEQYNAQGSSTQKRKRGKTKMVLVKMM